ncbi:hypothetical protein H3N91_000244 [Salmonella enterica]|nr:hypothetical protein [Salmonella enterica]EEA2271427.1 hypothetical protein [Salmonella enterica]EFV5114832.1 hypothetical protein [Salmonella enterica]EGB7057532.1 hypothetical protein [Salmonella enterica]EKL9523988.1 hypothetical protein [Salmonella enterica]
MKNTFAILHNQLLENYHFSNANNPERKSLNFQNLKRGFQNLFFVAQYTGDVEAAQELVVHCAGLVTGDIPEPLEVGSVANA